MKSKATIVDLPVYKPGKPIEEVKRELGLTEVTKLASNENPFGCSPRVREAIVAEMANLAIYPDGASFALREALATRLGVDGSQLLFGNGSDEIIQMLSRAYFEPGDETVMAESTFSQYRHNAIIEGATVIEVPLAEGAHDLEAMLARIGGRTKIVWICNPNNPTGTIVTRTAFETFMARVPDHVLVVVDEAYNEYIDDPDYPDTLALLPRYPNIVILHTFSKIYGLAALRIGYAVAHPDVIRRINQVREPFNTNRMAQAAALAALKDEAFVRDCRARNKAGLAYLSEQVQALGLRHYPAYGNFMMIDVGRPGDEVFQAILRQGVIIRYDASWKLPTTIRVTVGSREQNEQFVRALAQALGRGDAV